MALKMGKRQKALFPERIRPQYRPAKRAGIAFAAGRANSISKAKRHGCSFALGAAEQFLTGQH
jgi:hypothetical protein